MGMCASCKTGALQLRSPYVYHAYRPLRFQIVAGRGHRLTLDVKLGRFAVRGALCVSEVQVGPDDSHEGN